MVPIFGYFAYNENYLPAIIIFALAWFTDVLDGYIARKFNMVTSFGKLTDPLADKLMQVTALVFLAIQGIIFPFIVVIVVVKEILMAIGGYIIYKGEKYVVQSTWFGKISAGSFYVAIILAMFNMPYSSEIMIAALVVMLIAFLLYIREYFRLKKQLAMNK